MNSASMSLQEEAELHKRMEAGKTPDGSLWDPEQETQWTCAKAAKFMAICYAEIELECVCWN